MGQLVGWICDDSEVLSRMVSVLKVTNNKLHNPPSTLSRKLGCAYVINM